MFYLRLAIEAVGVLILGGLVVLQLPAGAALAAMACLVWFVWVVVRLVGRWKTPVVNTSACDSINLTSKASTFQ